MDSVVSTKLSPEPQERSSKVELLTIGSALGTVLLINVYWWELTGLLTALFLCHIGKTLALLVMKVFFLNLLKNNSRELLMIGILLARYSASPTIYGTVDPCELLGVVHLNVSVPQYRIVAHLKLKFLQEGMYKYTYIWNFHILKY